VTPDPTRSGLVHGLEEGRYHEGPELSVSGAKDLLRAPALFKHNRANPRTSDAFDLGSVVHTLVLGTGWPFEVVDGGRGKTERVEAARAAGKTPITKDDFVLAENMAQAVLDHPYAGAVFASDGEAEVSLFWDAQATDGTVIPCRARVDWMHPAALVDLKTARDASPAGFTRAAATLKYGMQAAAYQQAYTACTGDTAPPFLFIAVDKDAPHLVLVAELDQVFLDAGARQWQDALDLYAACNATGEWGGYGDQVRVLQAPRWAA